MHGYELSGEEVEDFVDCVIIAREVNADIEDVFVSGVVGAMPVM